MTETAKPSHPEDENKKSSESDEKKKVSHEEEARRLDSEERHGDSIEQARGKNEVREGNRIVTAPPSASRGSQEQPHA